LTCARLTHQLSVSKRIGRYGGPGADSAFNDTIGRLLLEAGFWICIPISFDVVDSLTVNATSKARWRRTIATPSTRH
jgi:hypothetical protein